MLLPTTDLPQFLKADAASRGRVNYFADMLDARSDRIHNSPPSLIAANENEAIETKLFFKNL
ncbi:hypothetical protein SB783_27130, partial [Paraburkholderia sp. SIMBA_009]